LVFSGFELVVVQKRPQEKTASAHFRGRGKMPTAEALHHWSDRRDTVKHSGVTGDDWCTQNSQVARFRNKRARNDMRKAFLSDAE
jgi:hypothetical protein